MSKGSASTAPSRRLRQWQRLFGGFLVGATVTACVALARFVGDGESAPPLTADALADAQDRWEDADIADYRQRVEVTGAQEGVYDVSATDGRATRAVRKPGGALPPRQWDFWTVEGLFDVLAAELEAAADPAAGFGVSPEASVSLYARFDEATGRPVVYRRSVLGADVDVMWRVDRFEVAATSSPPAADDRPEVEATPAAEASP